MSDKRIIIHNVDGVSDAMLGALMGVGFPDTGVTVYNTAEGEVCVAVIDGRKSRVYQVWKPYAEDVLLKEFTPKE